MSKVTLQGSGSGPRAEGPSNTRGVLEIDSLGRSFGARTVLRDVSFDIAAGEIVSLVGPSGSGKSTLLSILTGALAADSGAIRYAGTPLSEPRPFAYMPQRDVLLPWRRIVDNAAIGLEVMSLKRAEARRRVADLLGEFGLAGTDRLYPRQLSGGMRQRVSFLRTVVQQRPVLLLDEPFGALDAITRDELQQWLLEMWAENGWSMLLITHDIREAVRMSDRVLVLPGSAGPIAGEVLVPRDIDRGDEFLADPRVAQLEIELHRMLRAAAAG